MLAAVAGAGIAGLAAAIALARRGWSVEVFERSDAIGDLGTGIQLSPNAMAVLDRLGALPDVVPALFEPRAVIIRDARSGAFLNEVPLGAVARLRYGASYGVIGRNDLQAGLLAAARRHPGIKLTLGSAISGVSDHGEKITFTAGGLNRSAEILIAADGLRSAIRTGHFGHSGPRDPGKAAWRATLAMADVPAGIASDVTGLWLGPGGHLVHYPLQAGARMNLVVIADATNSARPPPHPFGPAARALLDAVAAWRVWPLQDIDARPAWVRGSVVLIGDAAHAMLPSAAQGGAQAIEDGWVLADALSRELSPRAGLLRFERIRRRRVERVVRQARRNLRIYEMRGVPAALRNIAIRTIPAHMHLARLDWLYAWNP